MSIGTTKQMPLPNPPAEEKATPRCKLGWLFVVSFLGALTIVLVYHMVRFRKNPSSFQMTLGQMVVSFFLTLVVAGVTFASFYKEVRDDKPSTSAEGYWNAYQRSALAEAFLFILQGGDV
jgi:RsiW-degrading membrane proteinase PrsW (M82 family)